MDRKVCVDMNIFLVLAFLFAVGSVLGWGLEVLYRHFANRHHRWINPGFLVGPYLPLYGFSLCILYLLASLEHHLPIENVILQKVILFVCMAICITVIEYIAGLIFIRGMKIKLWDYSSCWGNIKGIICPKFSFYWMVLSAVYYFFIHPYILDSLNWLAQNLAFSFLIGFFFGVFVLDLVYSLRLVRKIRLFAAEHQIVVRLEELKASIQANKEKRGEKLRFLFALHSSVPLKEQLEHYLEVPSVKKRLQELRERMQSKQDKK
jgi:uncharacterized membrane protein